MKKYTLTIFAILGTLALIYVIANAVNYFKFINSKPTITQISNNDENRIGNRKKLQNSLEINLVENHHFIYRFISSTDEDKTIHPIPISSESFKNIIMPLLSSLKKKDVIIELRIGKESKYKDIVDMLDIFTQNKVKNYTIINDKAATKE